MKFSELKHRLEQNDPNVDDITLRYKPLPKVREMAAALGPNTVVSTLTLVHTAASPDGCRQAVLPGLQHNTSIRSMTIEAESAADVPETLGLLLQEWWSRPECQVEELDLMLGDNDNNDENENNYKWNDKCLTGIAKALESHPHHLKIIRFDILGGKHPTTTAGSLRLLQMLQPPATSPNKKGSDNNPSTIRELHLPIPPPIWLDQENAPQDVVDAAEQVLQVNADMESFGSILDQEPAISQIIRQRRMDSCRRRTAMMNGGGGSN